MFCLLQNWDKNLTTKNCEVVLSQGGYLDKDKDKMDKVKVVEEKNKDKVDKNNDKVIPPDHPKGRLIL